MEKEEYAEYFRKEFLRLNFALDSYKHNCKANFAILKDRIHITFNTGDEKDYVRYEMKLDEAVDFMHDFKKKCIDICSHIKKGAL